MDLKILLFSTKHLVPTLNERSEERMPWLESSQCFTVLINFYVLWCDQSMWEKIGAALQAVGCLCRSTWQHKGARGSTEHMAAQAAQEAHGTLSLHDLGGRRHPSRALRERMAQQRWTRHLFLHAEQLHLYSHSSLSLFISLSEGIVFKSNWPAICLNSVHWLAMASVHVHPTFLFLDTFTFLSPGK